MVYPGTLRDFEGRGPEPKLQSKLRKFLAQGVDPVRKVSRVRSHVFPACVVISLIKMDVNVAIVFEIGSHPFSVS